MNFSSKMSRILKRSSVQWKLTSLWSILERYVASLYDFIPHDHFYSFERARAVLGVTTLPIWNQLSSAGSSRSLYTLWFYYLLPSSLTEGLSTTPRASFCALLSLIGQTRSTCYRGQILQSWNLIPSFAVFERIFETAIMISVLLLIPGRPFSTPMHPVI